MMYDYDVYSYSIMAFKGEYHMHRTQIYFEDDLIADIKKAAQQTNLSMSAYIRNVLKKELAQQKIEQTKIDFSDFTGIWQNRKIDQEQLRAKAWK